MNRRTVAFVCAILGLVAIGTLAPVASAHPLTAESYPARLFGEQTTKHVFTIEGGMAASCPVAEFEGKITEATGKSELRAEYHGSGENKCSAFGLAGVASISMNGCAYELRPRVFQNGNEFTGLLDLKCPEGQKITITSGTCEIQIGSQEGLGPVKYLNDPSLEAHKDTVTFKPEISGSIRYSKTKDGSGCPLMGTGEKTDGSYQGNTLIVGSNPTTKAPLDLSFDAAPALAAEAYPAKLVGQQTGEHLFSFEKGRTVGCMVASFSGELAGAPTEVPLGMEYSSSGGEYPNCKASGFPNAATVSTNGCRFLLSITAATGEGEFTGDAALDCPPGAVMAMKIISCEARIGDQDSTGKPINQNLGPVTFVNLSKAEPEMDEVEVSFEFKEEITYNKIDLFGCPFEGGGEQTGGSYVGDFILKGLSLSGEEPRDLFVVP
jgi:hypothetical protein